MKFWYTPFSEHPVRSTVSVHQVERHRGAPNLAQIASLKHQVNIIITTAESLQLRLRLETPGSGEFSVETNDTYSISLKQSAIGRSAKMA
jgi:hypothetical protein